MPGSLPQTVLGVITPQNADIPSGVTQGDRVGMASEVLLIPEIIAVLFFLHGCFPGPKAKSL